MLEPAERNLRIDTIEQIAAAVSLSVGPLGLGWEATVDLFTLHVDDHDFLFFFFFRPVVPGPMCSSPSSPRWLQSTALGSPFGSKLGMGIKDRHTFVVDRTALFSSGRSTLTRVYIASVVRDPILQQRPSTAKCSATRGRHTSTSYHHPGTVSDGGSDSVQHRRRDEVVCSATGDSTMCPHHGQSFTATHFEGKWPPTPPLFLHLPLLSH